MKTKYEPSENFIGREFNNGKLKVVGIHERKGTCVKFKVTCTECSKDKELFPDGYFVSTKGSLVRQIKPCGCAFNPKWEDWQFLIIARRVGEKSGVIVHGFAEEFKNNRTKLNLECLKDGHKWAGSIKNFVNGERGCPKCSGHVIPTEQDALKKCIEICKEMNYNAIGFADGYKKNSSRFEYQCTIHGKQSVRYNSFVNIGTRCKGCWIERLRGLGNGQGYYHERKDEQDFLYILNFNDKFIKVGRSFDVERRIPELQRESGILDIQKLIIFTATHQEIYDYEQELHGELRNRGFQHYVDWSTECFENDCLFILNKLLDSCGLEELKLLDENNLMVSNDS